MFAKSISQVQILMLFAVLSACSSPANPVSTESSQIPAGWEEFSANDFTLLLPESYEGGAGSQELGQVAASLRSAGMGELADELDARPQSTVFYAVDTAVQDPSHIHTVGMIFIDQPPFSSLAEYIEAYSTQIQTQGATILDIQDTSIAGLPAKLLIDQYDVGSGILQTDEYVIKVDDLFLSILFSTDSREYDSRHANFDTAAHSLVLK